MQSPSYRYSALKAAVDLVSTFPTGPLNEIPLLGWCQRCNLTSDVNHSFALFYSDKLCGSVIFGQEGGGRYMVLKSNSLHGEVSSP